MNIDPNHLADFHKKHAKTLKDIENFVHIVSDWLNEAIEEVANQPESVKTDEAEKKDITRKLSNQKLEAAQQQIDAQVQAKAQV